MKIIFNLSIVMTFIFCTQSAFSQTENISKKSADGLAEKVEESKDEPEIFKNHSWLKEMIDIEKCQGTKVVLLSSSKNSIHKFILIKQADGESTIYNAAGKLYCKDHSKVNCKEFYELDTEEDSFICK